MMDGGFHSPSSICYWVCIVVLINQIVKLLTMRVLKDRGKCGHKHLVGINRYKYLVVINRKEISWYETGKRRGAGRSHLS